MVRVRPPCLGPGSVAVVICPRLYAADGFGVDGEPGFGSLDKPDLFALEGIAGALRCPPREISGAAHGRHRAWHVVQDSGQRLPLPGSQSVMDRLCIQEGIAGVNLGGDIDVYAHAVTPCSARSAARRRRTPRSRPSESAAVSPILP